jgi:ferredoxin
MRSQDAKTILDSLLPKSSPDKSAKAEKVAELRKSLKDQADGEKWIPWFPVIDYSRCNSCKQCAGFCLFGVYNVSSDGQVRVQNPANCKTHCPACARVCPREAIIFPKHLTGPINGGPPSADEAEKTKVDMPSLVKDDVYAALRARNQQGVPRFVLDDKGSDAKSK